MISPDLALLAWILFGFTLTALRPGYKAFTWTLLGAVFFLPSNLPDEFQIAGLPVLSRIAVVAYGMVPATLLFHTRYVLPRLGRDWLLLLMAASACATSVVNGLSLYDGVSEFVSYLLQMVLIIWLARVHLRTVDHAKYFLKSLYWLAFGYAFLCVWEWRMSPQLHTDVYGYFPHMFLQMARGSFYRPVVFFGHGLEVGYLYAFVVLIGYAFVKNREPGIPAWSMGGPLVALFCSLSLGPWLFALFGFLFLKTYARRRLGPVLTLAPFVLLGVCLYYAGNRAHFQFLTDTVNAFSPDRAESLDYRLYAFELYIRNILKHPWLGHGTWGRGRIEGVATDASLLIYLLAYGASFAVFRYLWYWATLRSLGRATNRSRSQREPGRPRVDWMAASLYTTLWLAILYDFIVDGTTLILLVTCTAWRGDFRPAARESASAPLGGAPPETETTDRAQGAAAGPIPSPTVAFRHTGALAKPFEVVR
jgi:O-antigen ligase/polysaccharide polymerase Wzy-like membrane protein